MTTTTSESKQRELSPFEKEAIDRFLKEYVYDLNPELAAIRCGITAMYSKSVAANWMETDYFQNKLKQYQSHTDDLLSDEAMLKSEMLRNLIQIMKADGENSNPTARITAMDRISKLMGFDAKQQADTSQVQHSVMIVPAPLSIDEWSNQAQVQQAELYKQLEASL
jgi:hypothetical protein